jgi:hypothetical protein
MDHPQSSNYSFERLSKSQLPALQILYRESFGVDVSIDELEMKYDTDVFGAAYTGVIAYAENREPAAYYGVFPIRIQINGETLLVAQSGDTMTTPNHRMKGLFVKAAVKAYEIARQEGVKFVFGFPNENSYPGFKSKLNWEFHDRMYNFRLAVGGMPIAAIGKRFKVLSKPIHGIIQRRLSRISTAITPEIAGRFASGWKNGIVRDVPYFQYKKWSGAKLIESKGFTLLVKVDGELVIGDVVYFEVAQLDSFLSEIKRLSRFLLCHKVLFSLSKGHWLFAYLKGAGISPQESLPIGFVPLVNEPFDFESIVFSRLDYDTF